MRNALKCSEIPSAEQTPAPRHQLIVFPGLPHPVGHGGKPEEDPADGFFTVTFSVIPTAWVPLEKPQILFCCEPNHTAKFPLGSCVQTQTFSIFSAQRKFCVPAVLWGNPSLILYFSYVRPAGFPPCRGWSLSGHEPG